MRKRLNKEISAAEMERLRESGMSNTEIAAALEISYPTVLRYIGPQNGRADTARWAKREQIRAVELRARRPANLNITMERIGIVGTEMEIELQYGSATATLYGNGEIAFHLDQLPMLIAALGDIALHADELIKARKGKVEDDAKENNV